MAWRESFNVEPMIHANPIPTAARTGNMLFTSVIGGRDPETGQVPPDAEIQAANAFAILARVLERAGATIGDVANVKVYIKEPGVRPLVNKAWLAMFPDENSRPARHTVIDASLGGMVQIEAIAVVQGWS
jgi:2-iminobutanoate/2-iminopropanoate deaminase